MRATDILIVAICAALGFGIMRNILGSRASTTEAREVDSDDD